MLAVIKAAQKLGFTLDEVAELLDTGRRRHPTRDLQQRAVAKLAEVDRKIEHLHTIRQALTELIAAGVLTGAGAAILEKTLIAVAALLAAAALGMWWLHRRRQATKAAGASGCASGNCSC